MAGEGNRLQALVKALILDPDVPWSDLESAPPSILSRPYVLVPLAEGCAPGNAFGFTFKATSLPTTGVTVKRLPLLRRIGSVLQVVAVPHWFIVGLTLMPPLWRLNRHRRERRRTDQGLCPACGFDLCATPDRCPECGQPSGSHD